MIEILSSGSESVKMPVIQSVRFKEKPPTDGFQIFKRHHRDDFQRRENENYGKKVSYAKLLTDMHISKDVILCLLLDPSAMNQV